MALPANHKEVPANCEKTINGRIWAGVLCNLFRFINYDFSRTKIS
jgi:hypothetical protein